MKKKLLALRFAGWTIALLCIPTAEVCFPENYLFLLGAILCAPYEKFAENEYRKNNPHISAASSWRESQRLSFFVAAFGAAIYILLKMA